MGEYAAAVLAGTMSLEEGLQLVAKRAELIDQKCDIGRQVGAFNQLLSGTSLRLMRLQTWEAGDLVQEWVRWLQFSLRNRM